jgi:hypothetical protein
MQTLFEQSLALTSTQLLTRTDWQQWQGQIVEIWTFQDRQARLALEKRLAGVVAGEVRVRCAYKPLLHGFLEEVELGTLTEVQIHYPVHPNADHKRFLLEAYPLASLLSHCQLTWVAQQDDEQTWSLPPQYQVKLVHQNGLTQHVCVEAPNRLILDHLQETVLCPTGYLRVRAKDTGRLLHQEYFACEIEKAFATVMDWMRQYPWAAQEPYFERLEIKIEVPGAEVFDTHGVLMLSTLEALHEDVYFSALEFFQRHSGRPQGDRGLQPGQIVPDIRHHHDVARVKVVLYPVGSTLPDLLTGSSGFSAAESGSLRLTDAQLAQCSAALPAEHVFACLPVEQTEAVMPFQFYSRQGRSVQGLIRPGRLPAIVLSGGQHANEPSGVVGALRGANWLAVQPAAHFAVIPLENPDGYALCRQYCEIHPQHMHHAARYTGLGDDLEYREQAPWYERQARMYALDQTQAQLHLSLHGYPAHEWTRPFTGYLPRGFELWSIPKGFFLIVRYQKAWRERALAWLELITLEMSKIPGLAQFNQKQLEIYASHAGSVPFAVYHGIPCLLTQNDQQTMGVKLVTEFPDETVYGEAFRFAQEVQTQSVKIAAQAWWSLHSEEGISAERPEPRAFRHS